MSFQKQMLSQYNDLHRDKFNQELLERSDDKIIEKLYKLILSCQREQPRLVFKVKSFRVIENYSGIYITITRIESWLSSNISSLYW